MLEINKIYNDDCLIKMQEIDDKSISAIITDLPYGILNKRQVWDREIISFPLLWQQFERIIKDNGAIVLFSSQPFTTQLIASNYPLFRYDLVWEKSLATGFLNSNRMPLRSHEIICIFYKSLPTYNPQKEKGKPYKMIRRSDSNNYGKVKNLHQETNNESGLRFPKSILKFPADKEKLHPTGKPVELLKWLVRTYTNEGDLVLDACAGSCTTAVACDNLKRNWICIEKEQKFCEIGSKRINENRKNLNIKEIDSFNKN